MTAKLNRAFLLLSILIHLLAIYYHCCGSNINSRLFYLLYALVFDTYFLIITVYAFKRFFALYISGHI